MRSGGVGGVARHAIGGFDAGLAGRLVEPGAAEHEDLADAGEVDGVIEGGGGPDGALLDASVREGGRFCEVRFAVRHGGELQGDIEPQCGLVVLDGEEVMGVAFEEVGREGAWVGNASAVRVLRLMSSSWSRRGMTVPISLVRFVSSSAPSFRPTFFGCRWPWCHARRHS